MGHLIINFIHQGRPIPDLNALLDKVRTLGDVVQQHGVQIEGGGVFERNEAALGSLIALQERVLEGFFCLPLPFFDVCFLSA